MQFKLTESASKAGMLRNDGKYFPVTAHPYGTDGPDYTIEYCEWLYNSTNRNQTKQDVIDFVNCYMKSEDATIEEVNEMILTKFSSKFMSLFKSPVYTESVSLTELDQEINLLDVDLDTLDERVNYDLNQEFCRVRFGGIYDTDDLSGGECVFRISSKNFNWIDVIYEFVIRYSREIKSVTIVRDKESTGEFYYYRHRNKQFNQLPLDEFFDITGTPLIECIIE